VPEIEKDIAAVTSKIQPLVIERHRLEKELDGARLEVCGVAIGEVVSAQAPGGSSFIDAIVREIGHLERGKPWLAVSFKKKNGEWADRKNNVYAAWQKKVGK